MSWRSAVMHRMGAVRVLQELWRSDLRRSEERTGVQHDRLRELSTRRLDEVAKASRVGEERLTQHTQAIDHLATQLDDLRRQLLHTGQRADALEMTLRSDRTHVDTARRFEAACADGSIARHVAQAIDEAPLREEPAPMLSVERLFPAEVYRVILTALPPVAAFTVKDRSKADYRVGKAQSVMPQLSEQVWRYLDTDLVPHTVVPGVLRRFSAYVASYYEALFGPDVGRKVTALPMEASGGRLMLRRPGYHLEPHMDPKRVLLTGLLYFPRPGENEAYGTAFYRVDGTVVRDHSSTYYPAQDGHTCVRTHEAPFRANSAAVFLNSAAHGADLPADAPADLERYAFQFYVGPPVEQLRDVIRTLPSEQWRSWAGLLKGMSE